ncbi:MAG: mevalonate kinase [Candidatus Njordarchaeales archaeon]
MKEVVASAPCKTILFGEHAVVYGYPAIATAINLRVRTKIRKVNGELIIHSRDLKVTWKRKQSVPKEFLPIYKVIEDISDLIDQKPLNGMHIEIFSDVPPSCGLGTSAATAVSVITAMLEFLEINYDKNFINKLAFNAEKISHGTPSGIDNTVATFGGLIRYVKSNSGPNIERSKYTPEFTLILADSGLPRSTKHAVKNVAILREHFPRVIEDIFSIMGKISDEAWTLLSKAGENLKTIGYLMNINHGLLDAIGVNLPELETLVNIARKNGALGAKITGAGLGGFIIALAESAAVHKICSAIKNYARLVLIAKPDSKGCLVESKVKN